MAAAGTTDRSFFTTPWSLVLVAGSLDSESGRKALGELVQGYEPALTYYLRKKFCWAEPERATELFSAFVEKILVGKELVGQARPMAGHQFRQFLLTALHRFAVSELRRERARKRRPIEGVESLDELLEKGSEWLGSVSPVDFDVAWARNVVGEALRRMEQDCAASGRADIWGVFEHRLRRPILEGAEEMPYAELVVRFGLRSPTQAHNTLVTAKRKFEHFLREVISEYVADWSSVEVELRELQVILAHSV